ncbi:hypothetical protein DPEC_G00356600 [Dallia pectoralis]|uniref:Uncharacterized protein n=1 Tax=Dallia pectoralis TaxID=75939 RepID=A0ACC2EZS0_DALPE|nr:hypothetical protein DPEC_G00356600 [Dallia pectoralis]
MDSTSLYDYYSDEDYTYDTEDYTFSTASNKLHELCEVSEHQFTINIFQTTVFLVIFILGVLGNSLVITTFVLYRRLRLRSMTDVFLFQLAVADLLLLLTLPLQAGDTLLGQWLFGDALCKATRAIYAVNTYSGLLLLACISVDRYVVVAWAQEMLRLRGRMLKAGKPASLCVWLAAVLLSLPEILFSGVDEGHCGWKVWGVESRRVKIAANGAQIAGFCLPFLVMAMCYSLIGSVLLGRRGMGGGRRQHTLRLMVALVVVFLLFQLPYAVVLSIKLAGTKAAGQNCALWYKTVLMECITCTLAYTRCCLNPVLYALVGVSFRSDVQKLLHRAGCQFRAGTGSHTQSCSSKYSQFQTSHTPAHSISYQPARQQDPPPGVLTLP